MDTTKITDSLNMKYICLLKMNLCTFSKYFYDQRKKERLETRKNMLWFSRDENIL
jgi:hypothetical protein